jgi:hypothetical protein
MSSSVLLYPNPVNGKSAVHVQLIYKPAGTYTLTLYTTQGQQILRQIVQHSGGTQTVTLSNTHSLAAGQYTLEVKNEKGKKDVIAVQVIN